MIPVMRAEPEIFTRQQVEDKLRYWIEHLRELDAGTSNTPLSRGYIAGQIDYWLEELNTLIGPASARLSAA